LHPGERKGDLVGFYEPPFEVEDADELKRLIEDHLKLVFQDLLVFQKQQACLLSLGDVSDHDEFGGKLGERALLDLVIRACFVRPDDSWLFLVEVEERPSEERVSEVTEA